MIVHRITNSLYKDDISGTGAKLKGARWNLPGTAMLYTSSHISLSTLELLVHIGFTDIQHNFHLLNIYIPDEAPQKELDTQKLKASWREDDEYTGFIGTSFIRSGEQLILKVPSAVVPEEFNFLLNPAHPDFKKVKIRKSKPFTFDKRLYIFR